MSKNRNTAISIANGMLSISLGMLINLVDYAELAHKTIIFIMMSLLRNELYRTVFYELSIESQPMLNNYAVLLKAHHAFLYCARD